MHAEARFVTLRTSPPMGLIFITHPTLQETVTNIPVYKLMAFENKRRDDPHLTEFEIPT